VRFGMECQERRSIEPRLARGRSTLAIVDSAEHPLPHMTLRLAERRLPGNFRLLPDRRPLSRSRRPRFDETRSRPRFDETRSRLPRLLFENSLHDAGADAELLADLEDAITAGPQL
jgi:hypothetical protein